MAEIAPDLASLMEPIWRPVCLQDRRILMKKFLFCAVAIQLVTAPAVAQSGGNAALSMDQQNKISDMITRQTPEPLTNINFPVARDAVIPANVSLRRLPAEAEQLAPQLKGDSYLAVEELVAIVDTNSRKVISVMQRMRRQGNTPIGQ
jgi:hypothetical protein